MIANIRPAALAKISPIPHRQSPANPRQFSKHDSTYAAGIPLITGVYGGSLRMINLLGPIQP
ncbi:MAG: hypothetical protein ACRCYF_09210, partial [Shewanella sp.]